ncbi:hypothetical protein COT72_01655 [archaeon CG10_big_fil_rev_8_21_14_0_10_43_11]|nr:MAG: hypothetical protein COT72_01655 [archaeon CG10_big_fil_rev_8_21_14_0_10_43_11]
MENIVYYVPYVIGIIFMLAIIAHVAKRKRPLRQPADILYLSAIGLLIFWQLIDIAKIMNTSFILADTLMMMRNLVITLVLVFVYLFTIELKRELNVMDVVLVFPILLFTIYYSFQLPWMKAFEFGIITFYVHATEFFYWLSIIILMGLFSVKTLAVLYQWFSNKHIRYRVVNLATMILVSVLIAIIADWVVYPYFVKIPLGSAFVSIIVFASYVLDQRMDACEKRKQPKLTFKRDRYPEKVAAERICSFL